MLIDWFTVFAQIVNFLILIALLKFFLYGRIIKAMDEREEKIKSRFREAEQEKQDAAREAEKLRKETEELESQREKLLADAKEEAEKKKRDLIRQTRSEIENLKEKWLESLDKEKESFFRDLRRMVADEVFAISRRTLKDLANAEIEEQIIESFLGLIESMDQKEREELADSIKRKGNGIVVRSSFEMPSPLRQKVTRALRMLVSEDFDVKYEEDSDLILGVEIRTPDRKLAWSVENYIEALQEKVRQGLHAETGEGRNDKHRETSQQGEEEENESEKET